MLASLLHVLDPAPSAPILPAPVKDALLAWAECRGAVVRRFADTDRPAAEIAKAAMDECEASQEAMVQAGLPFYGAGWRSQVAELRRDWQAGLATGIDQLRSGKPVDDPSRAWGVCLGLRARELAREEGSEEQVADRVMQGCGAERSVVLRSYQASEGRDKGEAMTAEQAAALREMAVRMIRQIRAETGAR